MRYIGNKENIIDSIYSILIKNGVEGDSFFDFFAGTTSVGRYFKRKGHRIFSSDVMYMSYCMQQAYIQNNLIPDFAELLDHIGNHTAESSLFSDPMDRVLGYLSDLPPVKGFIYNNYTPEGTKHLPQPRMYFSSENGAKIDAIRLQIQLWHDTGLINDNEYFILITSLIESVSFHANVAGVYAAFHKKWDPRAIKPLRLRRIEFINNGLDNSTYNQDSMTLLDNVATDILYLDPPYNGRQYLPNYHLLETIAAYDNPPIKGVTGLRQDNAKKSEFCNARKALTNIDKIASTAQYRYLIMSYNSEGIMPQEEIMECLSGYGEVRLEQFDYTRFKSNNNGKAKNIRTVSEQLYILKRNE